jgi:hypothetical protein
MKIIKYRKIVVLGRLLVCLGFVLLGILLLNPAFNSDTIAPRKVYYFLAAIVSFLFFGRILVLLIYVLFKNPTMFSYDANKVIVADKEIIRKDIIKVELDSRAPTGILGVKTLAFALRCKDKKTVFIPTYYVLTKKEQMEIFNTLKQYVSNHKNIEIFK